MFANRLSNRNPRTRGAPRVAEFHDVGQLRQVLERERTRADRTGDPFSLLTLTPQRGCFELATSLRLAKFLKRRLRLTDDAGWLDDRRIGVVLAHTPAQGAWRVADDICEAFRHDVPPPRCEVFTYPTDFSGDLAGFNGDQPGFNGDEPGDPLGEDESSPLGDFKAMTPGGDALRRETTVERPVRSLDSFFVRRLPVWKRGLDILGAVSGLVVLSPLLAIAAAGIKLTSPGPVIFTQRRSGLGGKPFLMFKFRTMFAGADVRQVELRALNEQDGPAFKMTADPRVTRFGRLLRRTSIDELPQLWNVLRGEMSLVGPRPLPCHESEGCLRWQRQRLDVTPGLTCIWQVRGRSRVSFDEWVRMDVEYVRGRSLPMDLKLLCRTLPAVLRRNGAS
jgi:lipopolysaccharide/colanic/teichoic acid biosynthesis glycosyltransferase